MENFQLGHGAVESEKTITDVHIDNVQAVAPVQDFDIDYSGIVHDNQRAIGICTAADVADAMHKIFGFEVSEQFIYVLGKRLIDRNTYEGSSIKTMLQIAYKYGAPRKELVPTDNTHKNYQDYINVDFSPEVYADALNQRIAGYAQVGTDFDSIVKAGSISQTGIQFMIAVGNNFYTDQYGNSTWDGSKLSPLRAPNPITGAHSIKCRKGSVITRMGTLRNSWGDKNNPIIDSRPDLVWGNDGDIDFDYDVQKPYIVEAWTILPVHPNTVYVHTFTSSIKRGDTSAEVSSLQRVLARDGTFVHPVTGFYGAITAKAVYDFQVKYNVAPLDVLNSLQGNNVGPATRVKLNELYGQ